MRIYSDVDDAGSIILVSIFVVTILTAAAYTKWHFWWLTGWGRTRMLLLVSLAGLTLEPAVRRWSGLPEGSTGDRIVHGVGILAEAGVLVVLLYMLTRIVSINIQRVRYPEKANEVSRRYLQRTPGATQAEIDKLIAYWDETHSRQPVR